MIYFLKFIEIFKKEKIFMETQKNGEAYSDISDNPSNYLCEKSAKWIENNRELVDVAKYNESKLEELVNKLESDVRLTNEEKVFIYDDICNNYWHAEHRFAIDVDRVHFVFLDGIFERQMYDF